MIWVTKAVKVTQSEEQKEKRIKHTNKQKTKKRAHEGSQLLQLGKEQPWPSRPASRVLSRSQHVPQRKVSSSLGAGKEEPKKRPGRLSTKPTPAKEETKPKKATGKGESSDRKVQTQGAKGAQGKPVEMATQETKDLPASNGEAGNKESPASDRAGKKEVTCE